MIIEDWDALLDTNLFAQKFTHTPQNMTGPPEVLDGILDQPYFEVQSGVTSTETVMHTNASRFNTKPVKGDGIMVDGIQYYIKHTPEYDRSNTFIAIPLTR